MGAYTGRPGPDYGQIANLAGLELRFQEQNAARDAAQAGLDLKIQEQKNEQEAQAIRWQGAQDYQTFIDSGVEPQDALRRSASKLFYNDPRALATATREMNDPQSASIVRIGDQLFLRQPNGGLTPLPPQNYGTKEWLDLEGRKIRERLTEPANPPSEGDKYNAGLQKRALDDIRRLEKEVQSGNSRAGFEPDSWLSGINWGKPYKDTRDARVKTFLESGGRQDQLPPTLSRMVSARIEAMDAIKSGIDDEAVKKRFKATYGEDL